MTYDEIVAGLRQSNLELQTEGRLVRAGLKQEQNTAAIIERYSWLYSEAALEVARQAESEAGAEQQEARRRVRGAIMQGLVERETAATRDRLTTFFAGAEADLGSEGSLPFFTAQAEIAREPDAGRRDRLGEACTAVMEQGDDLALEAMASTMKVLRQLGFESYRAFWSDLKQIDYPPLMPELDRVVDACLPVYRSRVGAWMEAAGRRYGDCGSWHAAYFRGLPQHDRWYTADRFEPAMRRTFQELGLDIFSLPAVHLDLEDRPAKNPRACVWVPEAGVEVHLLTRPRGGQMDYAAFLHEAGHALHFGLTDPSIGWPLANLGRSMAYAELWSFLVERIGHDPEWLQMALGLDDQQAVRVAADLTAVDLMMYVRLCAKFAYELELFDGDPLDRDRGRRVYSQVLSERTGFTYDPRGWQFDRDEGFYSADYLRAFQASAALVRRLELMFGRPWWRQAAVGEWLRERWKRGWEPEAEETVAEAGGRPGSGEPLLEAFNGRLAAEGAPA